ncbi:MAG: DUF423 domain-containing protein [Candidatus Hodarchaeota archaeon]
MGILGFSGSLYLIVFTGLQWLEWIAPFGDTAFVLAWFSLAYSGFQNKSKKTKNDIKNL